MVEQDTSWIVPGAKIIEWRTYAGEQIVALRAIESVAPKTFVVAGSRIRKDRMEQQRGGDYGPTYHYVNPNSEEAKPLLRLRQVQRARRRVDEAMSEWRKIDSNESEQRVEKAQELANLLLDYIQVEQGR